MIHYQRIQFQNAKEGTKTFIHAKEMSDCERSHCITVTILPAICRQSLNGRHLNAALYSCLWCLLNMIIATGVNRLPYSCRYGVYIHFYTYIHTHSISLFFCLKVVKSLKWFDKQDKLICLSNYNYSSNSHSPSG